MRTRNRNGAQALVDALAKAGVEVLFGYPGGNVIDIFDSVRAAKFRFVLGRHEQGAVHMADGYARALGRPGVVLVTSGPGLTNAITGLGTANMDGVPLVLICGQVPLDQIGTDAFQEADTTGLTRAVSKHNFLVHSADEIPETVAQAFYIATHGKPGPVVIDVPRDCQQALTAATYPERVSLRAYHPESFATTTEVNRFAKLLNEARRPVLLAGGGVIAAGAAGDVVRLAHKAGVPVATTMMGLGTIPGDDPASLGMVGLYGSSRARRALACADVVLALGVRFNDRVTAAMPRRRGLRLVHVDCDPSSIDKNTTADLGIVADIKDLLTTVDSRIHPNERAAWKREIAAFADDTVAAAAAAGAWTPQAVVETVDAVTRGEATVVTDVGQHQLWAARHLRHVRPRQFLTSGGMGTMGFGIPAAIGAAIARPDRPVVALVGDGGAQMTAEELIVAAELKLPVAFVVFVNGALGLVRQMQKEGLGARYFATDLTSPDFVKLAAAYGVRGVRATDAAKLASALKGVFRAHRPALIVVPIDRKATV